MRIFSRLVLAALCGKVSALPRQTDTAGLLGIASVPGFHANLHGIDMHGVHVFEQVEPAPLADFCEAPSGREVSNSFHNKSFVHERAFAFVSRIDKRGHDAPAFDHKDLAESKQQTDTDLSQFGFWVHGLALPPVQRLVSVPVDFVPFRMHASNREGFLGRAPPALG